MTNSTRKLILMVVSLLLPSPAHAAETFFEREVVKERAQWELIPIEPLTFVSAEADVPPVAPVIMDNLTLNVNIPSLELTVRQGEETIKKYKVAVGALNHKTPVIPEGQIKDVIWNPAWYPPTYRAWAKDAKIEPPGPNNPLGPVKMPVKGDVILHGTNQESSIGRAASHGCMRMKNKEAMELAWFLQTRYSNRKDESWFERYQQNRRQTYWVRLEQQIPVSVTYDLISRSQESFTIHPDIYDYRPNRLTAAIEKVKESGVSEWDIDVALLSEKIESGENFHLIEVLRDIPSKKVTAYLEGNKDSVLYAAEH